MDRKPSTFTLLLGAALVAACAQSSSPQPQNRDGAAEIELSCSIDARDRYIEAARANGIAVRGEGDDAEAVATSEAQKQTLERLYRQQIADLEECRARFN